MMQNPEQGVLEPVDFSRLMQYLPELNLLRTHIDTLSFEQPIDSSNMNIASWQKLAKIIEAQYNAYDGFVVLHGSDTMAYTASALSFMLGELSKPVIFTGSQLPIGMVRTDGKENLITAIEIAACYEDGVPVVPEVAIYFENQLYRGNRTFKYNAEYFEAFISPNYPILARAGVHINFDRAAILKPSMKTLEVNTRMANNIAVLTLYPGISEKIVETALGFDHIDVLVLRTFGSGNAMTSTWFVNALKAGIDKGLTLVNSTQCNAGGVHQGLYATSAALAEMGVVSAGDMTLEAVLTKSMYLLGKQRNKEAFKKLFETNLRGERTD